MRGERLIKANQIAQRRIKRYSGFINTDNEWFNKTLRILRKTNVRCSCWMCGLDRKYHGPPFSEKKQIAGEM